MIKKIAVLIPCYNESKTITNVINGFRREIPNADIYVYDNNSIDGTDSLAKNAGAIVRYEYRQGKGYVIRSMFQQIVADCYIIVDGDDTYPADNVRELIEPILARQADMVVGDRLSSTYFNENKRAFHYIGNILVRILINKIFNTNIKDVMSGYRALSKVFVKNIPILSSGFEIETEMTIHALEKNFIIKEIPIQYRDRHKDNPSKLNTITDGLKVISTIIKLYKNLRPLRFFGLLSVIGLIIATILFIPIVIEYFNSGLVPRFPTLIMSGVILTISLLSLMCGVILDTVSKSNNFFYEIMLTRWEDENLQSFNCEEN